MIKIKTDISQLVTLISKRGDTFNLSITVKNSDDTNYDFTGYSALMEWKRNTSSPKADLTFSYPNDISISSGLISIKKDASSMNIQSGNYYFSLQLIDGDGNAKTWINGTVIHNAKGKNVDGSSNALELTINESGDTISLVINEFVGFLQRNANYYRAFLSQSSMGNPVATVINSSDPDFLGGIVWTRTDVGQYTGYLAGKFTNNKTWINIKPNRYSLADDEWNYDLSRVSDNALSLQVWNTANDLCDGFNRLQVEIIVYK